MALFYYLYIFVSVFGVWFVSVPLAQWLLLYSHMSSFGHYLEFLQGGWLENVRSNWHRFSRGDYLEFNAPLKPAQQMESRIQTWDLTFSWSSLKFTLGSDIGTLTSASGEKALLRFTLLFLDEINVPFVGVIDYNLDSSLHASHMLQKGRPPSNTRLPCPGITWWNW